ncbi:MAG: hypothetical protein B7Z34_02605 [Novosphingobium sp. 12-62-10]|nr:MAG: hypothetical protein B7Z34_02605 [Novosphingobium sp. 12-62-10]
MRGVDVFVRQHVHQHAQQYAPGQVFLQRKTPVWSTDVKVSVSGKERRRALWSYPVWRYSVSYGVLRAEPAAPDLDRLFAFFCTMQGQSGEFLYLDRGDNTARDQHFGTGDGTETEFQVSRTIGAGGISYTEPVLAFNGTPEVKVNGTITAVTTTERGKVEFATAPADGAVLTWSGSFFFEIDEMDIRQLMAGLWEGSGVDFRTVKA